MRISRRYALSLVLGQLSTLTLSGTLLVKKLVIVSSDSTAAFQETEQKLISELKAGGVSAEDIGMSSVASFSPISVAVESTTLYITLGVKATEALAKTNANVLSVLIPRSSFERILSRTERKPSRSFSAIYLDQSLSRQLALIRLALPQAKRIGVLWGADSWAKAPALRTAAAAQGFAVAEAGLSEPQNMFTELQQVLNDCDVFLAVADPNVFNSNTIRNLLLTTFRARIPVVAFSPAYVQAGALLALHASPQHIGAQAAAVALQALSGKGMPEQPVESNDFEVSVNAHVARSLNLGLDAKALRAAVRRWEGLP